ncbi:DUF3489 domain-containing protein [Erythrobacter sp.]|jgi:hypothetical protein|uniref:DUF3489 domain-containing protein n=1 Tax=Erythrobacter sp. TaxID=1042 RepID=UPI002EC0E100|nr:DUF3489 domain-containing protein [Erythrobacter sp.]
MSEVQDVDASNVSASLAPVSEISRKTPPTSESGGKPGAQTSSARKPKTKGARKARPTKAATVEKLLQRKAGASIGQIENATRWQPHTCRAFLTGLRKKGREIVREKDKKGSSIYRIAIVASDKAAS